jgi:hypothetical protein
LKASSRGLTSGFGDKEQKKKEKKKKKKKEGRNRH